ncbi:MAG: VOC family protein, partial [Chloroflexota bacterium]|nr:VOC family protein [Chloroflexota bacterium]
MDFVSIRVITDDVRRLVEFYEQATGLPARWATEDFAELVTPSCTLAIASTRTMQMFRARAARPADNHSAIIEFRVDDVDKEYEKLKNVVSEFLILLANLLWGYELKARRRANRERCVVALVSPASHALRRRQL